MRIMPQSVIRLHRMARCIGESCLGWLCFLFLTALPASALDVQQTKWGFDGEVVPGRFNVFSVLVINMDSAPFDGKIAFNKNRGMEARVGAVNELPCYLSPHSARWLQFYVFVENQYDHWRLSWGKSPKESQDFDPPKWSDPAQVILVDSDAPLSVGGAFKLFPDELFPSTVAATGGLDSLLLDHAPRWEPAKRKAFLGWLQMGGKVHLLLNAEGHYPVFRDELSLLNSPEPQLPVGAGMVVRHACTIRELRAADVPPPARLGFNAATAAPEQTTDSLLLLLSRMSQRQYNWSGIYLLSLLYLALVGPGIFYYARKWTDYRWRIALLLATVAAFSVIFNWVGRRGQGEASVIHSLSYARAIGGEDYDVMQWGNVFAVHGAYYSITHDAPHNLYATGRDYEPVNGVIFNGKEGRFVADIPMFSRRTYLHAAEMKGADIPAKIIRWDGGKQFVISIGGDFSKQVLGGWAVLEDRVYAMKLKNDCLEFDDAYKERYEAFVSNVGQPWASMMYDRPQTKAPADSEEHFQKMAKALIPWSLGPGWATNQLSGASAPEKRVQLFLFARSPKGFAIKNAGLGSEVGYVLYHFILAPPEKEGKS